MKKKKVFTYLHVTSGLCHLSRMGDGPHHPQRCHVTHKDLGLCFPASTRDFDWESRPTDLQHAFRKLTESSWSEMLQPASLWTTANPSTQVVAGRPCHIWLLQVLFRSEFPYNFEVLLLCYCSCRPQSSSRVCAKPTKAADFRKLSEEEIESEIRACEMAYWQNRLKQNQREVGRPDCGCQWLL